MVSTTSLLLGLLFIVAISGERVRYDNHKILSVFVEEHEDLLFLEDQLHNNQSLDFWIEPRFGQIVIRVSDVVYPDFTEVLDKRGIKWEKSIDNLQELIDEEMNENLRAGQGSPNDISFTKYNSLTEIHDWLKTLPTLYPNIATLVSDIGTSYNGYPLLGIKISAGTGTKRRVFFNGGIHAREWISPATVCWMIDALLKGYTTDPDIKKLVDGLEIYVLPVFNPDGYLYTFSNDRLWRKTRKPNAGSTCVGTDPNRNWNNHWGTVGISHNPCSETYCGSAFNSEPEVRAVSAYLSRLNAGSMLKGYIDFHAFSQLWLSPYGYTNTLPVDNTKIRTVGDNAANALRAVNGLRFTVGPIYSTIYAVSGSSVDFAYDDVGVVYSYAPELRPAANTPNGFVLNPSNIIPSGRETFAAVKVWLQACLVA